MIWFREVLLCLCEHFARLERAIHSHRVDDIVAGEIARLRIEQVAHCCGVPPFPRHELAAAEADTATLRDQLKAILAEALAR